MNTRIFTTGALACAVFLAGAAQAAEQAADPYPPVKFDLPEHQAFVDSLKLDPARHQGPQTKEEIKAELTKIFNEKTEQHALTKHYEKGLTCVTCHDQQRVGGPDWMTSVTAPEMKKNCGDCHETQKAVFAKTDTHQKITCVACHMPNIPSPEDFTGPDAVEQYYSAVRRSHLYRINTDPTAQTLIRSDAKEGSDERLWTYALDKKGHAYVDIVWSCGRATPGDYTLSGDAQGCHSPATSTLDEGLRYGSQQAIYDEIQKWQGTGQSQVC